MNERITRENAGKAWRAAMADLQDKKVRDAVGEILEAHPDREKLFQSLRDAEAGQSFPR